MWHLLVLLLAFLLEIETALSVPISYKGFPGTSPLIFHLVNLIILSHIQVIYNKNSSYKDFKER